MTGKNEGSGGRLGFLDSIGRLFRAAETPPAKATGGQFAKLESDFDAVVKALHEKIEERRRAPTAEVVVTQSAAETAAARELQRLRRMETFHQAIRADIEAMHQKLGTGIASADLDALVAFCEELQGVEEAGQRSIELLPRVRYAIAERLRIEAGRLAVDRLVDRLTRANMTWPDPTQYHPSATPEDIDRSRRRRLAGLRESFVTHRPKTTAERMLGIVSTWGSDYPDQGSPLWQEVVLEAIASGMRAELLRQFVSILREDADGLVRSVEESIGKELAALRQLLAGGVDTAERANEALASSLQVLDEVVPEIAWRQILAKSASARGEFAN